MPDLPARGAQLRWPTFVPAAHDLGAGALFALPLLVCAIGVGVLQVHHKAPGGLSFDQLADAVLFADAALQVTLNLLVSTNESTDESVTGFVERWAVVHQATGMVSVQLSTALAVAFVRLRAYAYAHDRHLAEVSRDIVARRLRLGPDTTI